MKAALAMSNAAAGLSAAFQKTTGSCCLSLNVRHLPAGGHWSAGHLLVISLFIAAPCFDAMAAMIDVKDAASAD